MKERLEDVMRVRRAFENYNAMVTVIRKLAPSLPLIPVKNDFQHLFTVNDDVIKYNNTVDKQTMLCFSTEIVNNTEKFEFRVTTIKIQTLYKVGVIAESGSKKQICNDSKYIYFYNGG